MYLYLSDELIVHRTFYWYFNLRPLPFLRKMQQSTIPISQHWGELGASMVDRGKGKGTRMDKK